MDLVLYNYSDKYHPVTQIARTWAVLAQIETYSEDTSDYHWNTVGNLPALRYDHHVFAKDHILDFLKIAFDLNFDLTEDERREADLIEEICFSKLHPSTVFAHLIDNNNQDFYEYNEDSF